MRNFKHAVMTACTSHNPNIHFTINRQIMLLLTIIFTNTSSYAQWGTQLDANNFTHLDRIYFLNENDGWAIGGNTLTGPGPYFFTINGGESWSLDPNWWPEEHWGSDILFISQDTGFIAGVKGIIHKTTNGGQSWIPIQSPATQNVIKLVFTDRNNGWGTLGQYNEGNILHTTDGGDSWMLESVFNNCSDNISNIFFISETTGWLAGSAYSMEYDSVLIKKTKNRGESWETLDSLNDLSNFYLDIYFSDSSNGWVVGSCYNKYLVRKTEDGGVTWTEQVLPDNYNGAPTQASCVFFINDTTGWIGTGYYQEGSIYFTNNGGQNWQLQQDFPQPVFDIQMLNQDTGWAIGGDFIYHTTNGSFITNVVENYVAEEPFKIVPNPVSDIAQIISVNRANELFNYQVLDILGRKQSEGYNMRLDEIRIDPKNFKNGLHFLKLISLSDNSVIIIKFLSNLTP